MSAKGIWKFGCVFLAAVLVSMTSSLAYWPQSSANVALNNNGVKALNSKNYDLAIQYFAQALQNSPNYKLAKDNLVISYNERGLKNKNNAKSALKDFHAALYLNPGSSTTKTNLEGIVKSMKMDPKSFDDRVSLAKTAEAEQDFVGAAVEYTEALKIKDDPSVHEQLSAVYKSLGRDSEAESEAQKAAKS
jgi:tetratricopeptide (TPR) repeat protein